MSGTVLLDTGPLVAFLQRRDRYHAWAREAFANVEPPMRTCEAVLSEACFLLGPEGGDAVLEMLVRRAIVLGFRLESELAAVRKLAHRYRTVPMSLADACLVRMAELDDEAVVMTLDSDFYVYRRHGRQGLGVLSPR